jgi:hypothetical protein
MSTPLGIFDRLAAVRYGLGLVQCDTPGVRQLGDCVEQLTEIVGELARNQAETAKVAAAAGNTASCLANGIKPD